MQKLTLLEDIMPHEIVLYYFPTADDEDIDFILWNKSRFPYGPIDKINEDIYEWYLKNKAMKGCVNRDFVLTELKTKSTVIKYESAGNATKLTIDIGKDSIVLDIKGLSTKNILDYFNAEFKRINANIKMEL